MRCAITDWRRTMHRSVVLDNSDNQVVPDDDIESLASLSVLQSVHANEPVPSLKPGSMPTTSMVHKEPDRNRTVHNLTVPAMNSLERATLDRHVLFLRTILGFGAVQGRKHAAVSQEDVNRLTLATTRWVLDTIVEWLCDFTGDDSKTPATTSLITEGLAMQAIRTIGSLADQSCHRGGSQEEVKTREIVEVIIAAARRIVAAVIDNRSLENVRHFFYNTIF